MTKAGVGDDRMDDSAAVVRGAEEEEMIGVKINANTRANILAGKGGIEEGLEKGYK